jgi:hypothetical protein
MTIAEEFWKQADLLKLSKHWNYQQKLSFDIQKIIPHIRYYKNVSDIACGEALVVKILNQIFQFESVYLCDINENILWKTLLETPLNFKGEVCNLNDRIPQEVVNSEMVLWLGGINFVFEDYKLIEILKQFNNVIIRACCYPERNYIKTFSKELNANYEILYRTKEFILEILKSIYKSVKCERIYPKYLESRFGGIQYLFVGEKNIGKNIL